MAECTGCGTTCTVTCGYSCSGTLSANSISRINKINIPTVKQTTMNNSKQKTSMTIKKSG